jgi:2-amino-4-hydroxy-6-hydroxymethyldihydropteridine diphosphokinase
VSSFRLRRVVLGLGSNLGDRVGTVRSALGMLRRLDEASQPTASSLYLTRPVGGPPQPDFVNAAVMLRAAASAPALLEAALELERRHGRARAERFGPRTLDVDLLWIEGEVVHTPGLTVPHPRLLERAFALAPLLEVAPDARDPATGRPLAEGLARIGLGGVLRLADGAVLQPAVRRFEPGVSGGAGARPPSG